MKSIEIEDDLYFFIANHTENIGESASDILRRMLFGNLNLIGDNEDVFDLKYNADKFVLIYELLHSYEYKNLTKVVDKFLNILSVLYKVDKKNFIENANMKGRTRVYLSDSKDILMQSGSTTKPRLIPESPYWVITNLNTERKKKILMTLMNNMKYENEKIQEVLLSI